MNTPGRLFHGVMDLERRQRLVERVWLLEQLRAEARTRARRARADARHAREAAATAQREAADLQERVAELGGELADLHDQLGDATKATEERADARAHRLKAADET
jgi:predicted  nucleic acid-binding Zn-ribbon protein